jgi:hypothetical protein
VPVPAESAPNAGPVRAAVDGAASTGWLLLPVVAVCEKDTARASSRAALIRVCLMSNSAAFRTRFRVIALLPMLASCTLDPAAAATALATAYAHYMSDAGLSSDPSGAITRWTNQTGITARDLDRISGVPHSLHDPQHGHSPAPPQVASRSLAQLPGGIIAQPRGRLVAGSRGIGKHPERIQGSRTGGGDSHRRKAATVLSDYTYPAMR